MLKYDIKIECPPLPCGKVPVHSHLLNGNFFAEFSMSEKHFHIKLREIPEVKDNGFTQSNTEGE